jgi:hypothetical protein
MRLLPTNAADVMRHITTKQFVWSAAFLTLGCILWLLPGNIWLDFAPGCIVISTLITMSREERGRPLPAIHIIAIFASLALVVVAGLALHRIVPDEWGKPVLRVMRHPVIVIPLWAVTMFLTYRQWRQGKTETHAA